MRKLVEWVLNITQARYDAHRAGEPDPYDLPAPAPTTSRHLMDSGRCQTNEAE